MLAELIHLKVSGITAQILVNGYAYKPNLVTLKVLPFYKYALALAVSRRASCHMDKDTQIRWLREDQIWF
jgi:hypothetical protein